MKQCKTLLLNINSQARRCKSKWRGIDLLYYKAGTDLTPSSVIDLQVNFSDKILPHKVMVKAHFAPPVQHSSYEHYQ